MEEKWLHTILKENYFAVTSRHIAIDIPKLLPIKVQNRLSYYRKESSKLTDFLTKCECKQKGE